LRRSESLTELDVSINGRPNGHLFVQPSADKVPSWLSLFRGSVNFESLAAYNANTAAVWLTEVSGRLLALAFGYGRNLLRPGVFEEDFGLRVTLNAVDSDKIRSVDRMTLDAISQHSRIQSSRDANISEFGLDIEQDLLRAVTGAPSEPRLGKRLTGKDGLQITVAVGLGEISVLLARYLEEYNKQDYKTRFPWVTQIHEVSDPAKESSLDVILFEKLRTRNLDRLWLAVPEMMDWEGLAGFRYRNSKRAALYPDIHVNTFLDSIEDPADIDDFILKRRHHVQAIAADNDAVVRQWPVYRCLYCEVNYRGETYLLNNAHWFRIAAGFVERINDAIARIPQSSLSLPAYSDASEASYCRRVAQQDSIRYALMDRHLIGCSTLPNRVEFCDLYSSERQLIHLKRYSGSSTLSHLFAQGVVSGRLFLNEADFRREVNTALPESYRLANPDRKPAPDEFEVVYGIISQSPRRLILPFFSRVNLKNAYSNLRSIGLRVSVAKVETSGQPIPASFTGGAPDAST
jgi:uncharacterized protein (TIGR04141 family)